MNLPTNDNDKTLYQLFSKTHYLKVLENIQAYTETQGAFTLEKFPLEG